MIQCQLDRAVLSLALSVAIWAFAGAAPADPGEVATTWNQQDAEATATYLAETLRGLDRPDLVATREEKVPGAAARGQQEIRLAASEMEELASLLRAGMNREDTIAIFRRLQARLRTIIDVGQMAETGAPPKEEIEAARELWKALSSYYQ